MSNLYITEGIDEQKCLDDANRKLNTLGEESMLHYHKHEIPCNHTTQKHVAILKKAPEREEDNEVTKLKERLSKAANMLDNYDSDRLPYEYMLEFNDFRIGLKKLLLQGVE